MVDSSATEALMVNLVMCSVENVQMSFAKQPLLVDELKGVRHAMK